MHVFLLLTSVFRQSNTGLLTELARGSYLGCKLAAGFEQAYAFFSIQSKHSDNNN